MKRDVPFGAWTSPITSKAITAGSVSLGSIKIDADGNLLWIEGRPQEGGRNVVCQFDETGGKSVDVTPKDSNVRTRVHEYGGAALVVGEGEQLYYSEFTTQQVMKLTRGKSEEATAISPAEGNNRYRFADGILNNNGNNELIMVREDHDKPEPKDVVNEIASLKTDGSQEMKTLATGNDFYAAPRLSPNGKQLAYITWNHPNMPWDSTELRLVNLDDSSSPETSTHTLIAGENGDTSVMQPLWSPTSGDLFYISDESGYYNIYRHGTKESILPMTHDFGGRAPGWVLGQQGFSFLSDGRLVATYNREGKTRLVVANVEGIGPATDIKEYGQEDGLPPMFGGVIHNHKDNDLYFIGGSPSTPTSIYKWSLKDRNAAELLVCSSTLKFDDKLISVPRQLEFPTTLGTAFGFYYPPTNPDFESKGKPPLLVKAHGGPTACTGTAFNAGIQYWTSRGFAILDVDYGGSTGYGRDYRRRLRGQWGIVDVDDVCAGAQYLVKEGLVDPGRLCIDGGSAGGFTTLAALAFRDLFTAGCSLYGVADLGALAGDTHKFESRYMDGLVGKFPQDEAIYKERSPIKSVDKLNCPILLLQGEEDKIVPPNQAELMHEALLDKKIPTCLKVYKGEQHGFRKAENIEDALDSELAFYRQVYGIPVPSNEMTLEIDNM